MALYGYNPETGKELWRFDALNNHSGACRPVVGDELAYAPLGAGGEMVAIRPDGAGVVSDAKIAWRSKRGVPKRPSPLLIDGLLYTVDDSGVAACRDARTGKEIWRKRVGGNFSASPIYADGKIYFLNEEGESTVIEPGREYKVLGTGKLDDGFMASPAVSGEALYLRTRSHLYRIEDNARGTSAE